MTSELPSERDLSREMAQLESKVQRLESVIEQLQERPRTSRKSVLVGAGLVLGLSSLLGVSGVLAADGACPNGLRFCFDPGTPARASEVNHNFAQLLEWLEGKVGPVESGDVSVSGNVRLEGASGQAGVETQNDTLYTRSAKNFAWYQGGVHDPAVGNPGGGSALLSLDGTNPQQAGLRIRTPNGTLAPSRDFTFADTGDNWLSLRNGADTGYGDLKVRDLWVEGTVHFKREPCREVMESNPSVVWVGCADGEFVAAIDFDANEDNVGGVLCCRF